MFSFDPTITSGALLNAGMLLIGFVIAFTKIGGRIDLLTLRITAIEEIVRHAQNVNERLAIIETRQGTDGRMIVNLQNEQADMKHGRGFVKDRASGGIDGEYS